MRSETYFHTEYEIDADRKNPKVQDFYYIYMLKGKLVMADCELLPGDVLILEPERLQQYHNEGETAYLWVHYTGFEAPSLTKSVHLEINQANILSARG